MEFRIILKILTLSLLAWNVISVEELTEYLPTIEGGDKYYCHGDICTSGLQFCDHLTRTCRGCEVFHKDCFRPEQLPNCTAYCMDQWKQNEIAKDKEESHQPGQTEYKIATIVLGAFAGFLVVTVVFLTIFYMRKAQVGNQRMTQRGDPVDQPEGDPGAQEPLDPQQHGN